LEGFRREAALVDVVLFDVFYCVETDAICGKLVMSEFGCGNECIN
jgi:hypothetical protein